MGTWGTGIFADDTSCDVRDEYRDMIADGVSDAEARERIIQEYLERESELKASTEPTFWLALARTQWEIGRLDDTTKAKALAVIDSGADLENCRLLDADASFLRKRAAVLQKLRLELESPQKSYKKLRPRKRKVSPYRVGDVLRFTLDNGRFVLFRVTCISVCRGDEFTSSELLDWVGSMLPSFDEMCALKCRKRIVRPFFGSLNNARFLLEEFPKEGFDRSRVQLVASGIPMPQVEDEGYEGVPWPGLSQHVVENFGLQ